ncbi:MAG: hypothetical protein HOO06_12275 [Bdellovibrionaceae bacterium]|nr:hypothetical protein [Pseudobdellovibrionaceae bacterium]
MIFTIRFILFFGFILFYQNSLAQVMNKKRLLPERYNLCQKCHKKKKKIPFPSSKRPQMEHRKIGLKHGHEKMSCNYCHNRSNHNYLRSTEGFPADFKNSSFLCGSCHGSTYRDWKVGVHGKRVGKWSGIKTQFQCIDCHGSHGVIIDRINADPAMKRPKFGIKKKRHH